MPRTATINTKAEKLTTTQSMNNVQIANSDGWDTYKSDRVVIQDSYIINTDGKSFTLSHLLGC